MAQIDTGSNHGPPRPSGRADQFHPIVSQPMVGPGTHGLAMTQIPVGVPPGLEALIHLDAVVIKQEYLGLMRHQCAQNKYNIFDKSDHQLFSAQEDTDCLTKTCTKNLRPFQMPIVGMDGHEAFSLNRPFACGSCWFPCCLQSIEVVSSQGALLGIVEQEWAVCSAKYVVKNDRGEAVLRIEGPCITCGGCAECEFKIFALDGKTKVGSIFNKLTGDLSHLITSTNCFGIQFPLDLDVNMKATMIGACMLIELMYFEPTE